MNRKEFEDKFLKKNKKRKKKPQEKYNDFGIRIYLNRKQYLELKKFAKDMEYSMSFMLREIFVEHFPTYKANFNQRH